MRLSEILRGDRCSPATPVAQVTREQAFTFLHAIQQLNPKIAGHDVMEEVQGLDDECNYGTMIFYLTRTVIESIAKPPRIRRDHPKH